MGDKVVKGMDVGHKDNNPMNNDPSNLRNEDPSVNRKEPRLRNEVKQDKDIKKSKGTEPAKYYAKDAKGKDMAVSTKKSRDTHFTKGAKMDDDNPAAYKPAPGDKGKKTKPSTHTKKFKQMYGEELPKDADVGDYIDDFRKSDAPQFKGKSDKKIKDMAIAAYLSKNEELDMDIYQLDEKIEGLVNKAKKTGMPYGILKKVYDRGMAAWRTGHRPGTTPQQWAMARVNSFTTKSSGTWGKADKDLAAKVRASEGFQVDEAKFEVNYSKNGKLYSKSINAKDGDDAEEKAIKKFKIDADDIRTVAKEDINEWFESNQTRAKYQLSYGDDWWWKLNEVHDAM